MTSRTAIAVAAAGLVGAGAVLLTWLSRAPAPGSRADAPSPSAAPAPAPAAAPEPREAAAVSPPPAVRAETPRPAARPAPAAPVAEAAPTWGTLRVDTDVPGAQVFIDRQFVGQAPVTVDKVAPGTHRLNVSAEGYEGIAETIDVAPGSRDITVKLREVRLDVASAVVHKHRIGSCQGRLLATPRGLRYETPDRGDAFEVPLLDIEAFEVDYLEKNLRLRVRGRTYNFTDPEGSADRLFVFHRDVEKARERLKRGDPPASP